MKVGEEDDGNTEILCIRGLRSVTLQYDESGHTEPHQDQPRQDLGDVEDGGGDGGVAGGQPGPQLTRCEEEEDAGREP